MDDARPPGRNQEATVREKHRYSIGTRQSALASVGDLSAIGLTLVLAIVIGVLTKYDANLLKQIQDGLQLQKKRKQQVIAIYKEPFLFSSTVFACIVA